MYGTKTGELLDQLAQHMYELVKTVDARGGYRVHEKGLDDPKGDEVQCRLVAAQLALGDKD